MQKTKIEWCDSTWNPITGCRLGCSYCYAAKIAKRFGGHGKISEDFLSNVTLNQSLRVGSKICPFPYDFTPTFHRYRLDEPVKHKKPQRIFVVSMGDLFGDWVPDSWIVEVFEACKKAPQHKYLFLTKNPKRYYQLLSNDQLPELPNFFYGTTINSMRELDRAFFCYSMKIHTFLSIEPILEAFPMDNYDLPSLYTHDLVILGAETGNRKEKIQPKKEWITPLLKECDVSVSVFMKDSLIPVMGEEHMLREIPFGMRTKKGANR